MSDPRDFIHARSPRAVLPSRTMCDESVVWGAPRDRLLAVTFVEFGNLSTPPRPWCPGCASAIEAERVAAAVRRDADDAPTEELEAASDLLDRLRRG